MKQKMKQKIEQRNFIMVALILALGMALVGIAERNGTRHDYHYFQEKTFSAFTKVTRTKTEITTETAGQKIESSNKHMQQEIHNRLKAILVWCIAFNLLVYLQRQNRCVNTIAILTHKKRSLELVILEEKAAGA